MWPSFRCFVVATVVGCLMLSTTRVTAADALVTTCDEGTKTSNPNYANDKKWCDAYAQTFLTYPVCGLKNAKLMTFHNRDCAQCNGLTHYSNGSCADQSDPTVQPAATTIASCPSTADDLQKENCNKVTNIEPTCVGTDDYFNLDCALCNGVDRSQVQFGSCANPVKAKGACLDPDNSRSWTCLYGSPFPICSRGTTYRNMDCGLCNNVGNEWVSGTCGSTHPCESHQCPDFSHCQMSIFDCDFESNICGWSNSGVKNATTTINDDGEAQAVGGLQSLSLVDSTVTSDAYNVLTLRDNNNLGDTARGVCTLKFLVSKTNHQALKLSLGLNQQSPTTIWDGSNAGMYASGNGSVWAEQTVELTSLTFVSDPSVDFKLSFSSHSSLTVTIDNVRLVCEEEHSGSCACDAGYSTVFGTSQTTGGATLPQIDRCVPSLARSIEGHTNTTSYSLSVFWSYLQRSPMWKTRLMNATSESYWVVFAPTNKALASLPVDTDPTTLVSEHVVGPLPVYPQRQSFVDNFNRGLRNLTWLGPRGNNGNAIAYTFLTYDEDKLAFGKDGVAKEVVELATINGLIYVVDGIIGDDVVDHGSNLCGPVSCGAHQTCRAVPAKRGDVSAFFRTPLNSECPTCTPYPDLTGYNYVCSTQGNSYRDSCIAECKNETVLLQHTSCLVGKCVCDADYAPDGAVDVYQYVGANGCAVPPPTPPATYSPTSAAEVVPMRTVYDFFINGSFYDLVGPRATMMDGPFTELLRNTIGRTLELSSEEWGEFELDIHPSARMPGYILAKIATYNLKTIEKLENALDQGLIKMNWFNSSNTAQHWKLKGMPLRNLPPIVKYSFLVDVNYAYDPSTDTPGVICKTESKSDYRGCFNEVVNQESFILDNLIWTLQNTHNLKGFDDLSKLHMWPHRSVRPGREGLVEVVATALEMNSDVLVNLRNYIEDGKLSKIMIMVSNTENKDGNVIPVSDLLDGVPDSAGRGGSSQVTLQAEISSYPGTSLVGALGTVLVEEGKIELQLRVTFTLVVPQSFETGGIHIHSGQSCELSWLVKGHYYFTKVDPWTTTWTSQADGSATGSFLITSGYKLSENENHAVVIHNSEGLRIGCGVLTRPNWERVQLNNGSSGSTSSNQSVVMSSTNGSDNAGISGGLLAGVIILIVILIVGLVMYLHVTKSQIAEAERKKKSGKGVGHVQFENSTYNEEADNNDAAVYTIPTDIDTDDGVDDVVDGDITGGGGGQQTAGYMEVSPTTTTTTTATNPFM